MRPRENGVVYSSVRKSELAASRWKRLVWLLSPALVFVGLLAFGLVRAGGTVEPGDRAPDFTAARLDGAGSISLSSLRGRPVVLNFWASWCVPCRDEAPLLRQAERVYGDRVQLLGVDIRDARPDALRFVDRYNIEYPSVRDESLDVYDAYGLTGQPETFFIDDEGVVVEHVNGPLLDREQLFRLLDVLVSRDG